MIDKIAIVTEQLIELAWEGNDVATEERSRLFFGGVLDEAFKVRKNTKLELRRRGRAPIDDIE